MAFTMVTESELTRCIAGDHADRAATAGTCRTSGPVETATRGLQNADWSVYSTYFGIAAGGSRLAAIRLLLGCAASFDFVCTLFIFRRVAALGELAAARADGLPVTVESCPHYLHFLRGGDCRLGDAAEMCAADSRERES